MKILFIVLGSLLALFVLLLLVVIIVEGIVYHKRGDGTISVEYPYPSNLVGIDIKKDYFVNKNNYRLSTYYYVQKDNKTPKALVLMIHGIGCGHFYLYPMIKYLCSNGYAVLAYDQFASGTSEGKKIGSMTTANRDVPYFLNYVESHYKGIPLYLFGHSWGGYAASIALHFSHSIEKAVIVSGFNREDDVLKDKKFTFILRLFMRLVAYIRYGKNAKVTALQSFKETNAKVLYLQGLNDDICCTKYSGIMFKNKLKDKENINVCLFENKGHSPFLELQSEKENKKALSTFKLLGDVLIPLDKPIDFAATAVPDMEVYKQILDFYNN